VLPSGTLSRLQRIREWTRCGAAMKKTLSYTSRDEVNVREGGSLSLLLSPWGCRGAEADERNKKSFSRYLLHRLWGQEGAGG